MDKYASLIKDFLESNNSNLEMFFDTEKETSYAQNAIHQYCRNHDFPLWCMSSPQKKRLIVVKENPNTVNIRYNVSEEELRRNYFKYGTKWNTVYNEFMSDTSKGNAEIQLPTVKATESCCRSLRRIATKHEDDVKVTQNTINRTVFIKKLTVT